MNTGTSRGFTLIEVVLAIAVGLIIIAGVSVGYTYAKRAAIIDNARKTVSALKGYVEQSIAAQQAQVSAGEKGCPWSTAPFCAPLLSTAQMKNLGNMIPQLQTSVLTGRHYWVLDGCNGFQTSPSCPSGNCSSNFIMGSFRSDYAFNTNVDLTNVTGSYIGFDTIEYFSGMGNGGKFTVGLGDGSTNTYYGYVIIMTDEQGTPIVADGGGPEWNTGRLSYTPPVVGGYPPCLQ